MNKLFGISMDSIMTVTLTLFLIVTGLVAILALRNRLMFKLGLRNIPRRRAQTVLIIVGLMLSTVIITSAFSTGDTVSYSFRTLGTVNLGAVDEMIANINGSAGAASGADYFPASLVDRVRAILPAGKVDGVSGLIVQGGPIQDATTRQTKANADLVGIPADYPAALGPLTTTNGQAVTLAALAADGVYLNERAGHALNAHTGDVVHLYIGGAPVSAHVQGILRNEGLAAGGLLTYGQQSDPTLIMPAARLQTLSHQAGNVNLVVISNRGDDVSGATYSDDVTSAVRTLLARPAQVAIAQAQLRTPTGQTALQDVLKAQSDSKVKRKLQDLQRLTVQPAQDPRLNALLSDPDVIGALKTLKDPVLARPLHDAMKTITPASAQRVKTLLSTPAGQAALQSAATGTPKVQTLKQTVLRAGTDAVILSLLRDPTVSAAILAIKDPPGIAARLNDALASISDYNVLPVKQLGIDGADQAGSQFTSFFLIFGLFSIAAGIMLIFLIFVMLAAERRAEMGMARAIGTKRRHLIQQFLFEGYVYDLGAALVGMILGTLVGLALVTALVSLFGTFGFTIQRHIEPRSLVVSFCIGALVTFLTVVVSSWRVSRLNVVAAIRDLPDDIGVSGSIGDAFRRPFTDLATAGRRLRKRRILGALKALLAAPLHMITGWFVFFGRGPLLVILGIPLVLLGLSSRQQFPFSLGISLILVGIAMLVRWIMGGLHVPDRVRNRIGYSLSGIVLVIFWLLPFDALQQLGVPALHGDIEMFFLSGIMLVLGGVWTVMFNIDVLLNGLLLGVGGVGRLAPILKMAVTYPTQHRFRTGLTLVMFSLVVFTLMVMSVLAGTFSSAGLNTNRDTGGYDAIGQTSSINPIRDINAQIAANPSLKGQVAAAGGFAPIPVGLRQPGQTDLSWQDYRANVVDAAYLATNHWTLHRHADGYATDAAVWQKIATTPGYAVVDATLIPTANGNNGGTGGFQISGFKYADKHFKPVRIEMRDSRTGVVMPITVIGVLDTNASFLLQSTPGVYTGQNTLAAAHSAPVTSTVFAFRAAPGQNVHQMVLKLGSVFLANGLDLKEAAVEYSTAQAASNGFWNLLKGFMGLGLVVGIAALGVIATRSVVERRQQIGMMRAIGFQRSMVRTSFLLESSFVAILGTLIGVVLGLLLAHQLVDSFAKDDTSIHQVVPWTQVVLIIAVAYVASLLTTYLPAWQASRIYPAEALRYE